MHIYSITVNAQGAGDHPKKALDFALARLDAANAEIQQGKFPTDPGVTLDLRDPGGGPCAPQKVAIEIIIDADVLMEAQSRDDD